MAVSQKGNHSRGYRGKPVKTLLQRDSLSASNFFNGRSIFQVSRQSEAVVMNIPVNKRENDDGFPQLRAACGDRCSKYAQRTNVVEAQVKDPEAFDLGYLCMRRGPCKSGMCQRTERRYDFWHCLSPWRSYLEKMMWIIIIFCT